MFMFFVEMEFLCYNIYFYVVIEINFLFHCMLSVIHVVMWLH